MEWINVALGHLPEAAGSPLALVAYVLAVLAGTFLSWQLARNASWRRTLESLPESRRDARAREIIGQPIPDSIDAEQWIRNQRNRLVVTGLTIICMTAVAIFAIAASRPTPKPTPTPVPTPVPTPSPTPSPATDIDLLKVIRLRTDLNYIHTNFGAPIWSDKAQPYRPKAEVYRKDGYDLTVGYDETDHVSIFSVAPTDDRVKASTIEWAAGFSKTFSQLGSQNFMTADYSAKFAYYAEGYQGGTEADGHRSYGYFYSSSGMQEQSTDDRNEPSLPLDQFGEMEIGGDVPKSPEMTAWRNVSHPNGYFEATSDTDLSAFFFLDYDWLTVVPN